MPQISLHFCKLRRLAQPLYISSSLSTDNLIFVVGYYLLDLIINLNIPQIWVAYCCYFNFYFLFYLLRLNLFNVNLFIYLIKIKVIFKITRSHLRMSYQKCWKKSFWSCRWRTGKYGVLQSMGLQRVGHDWVTEWNWTDLYIKR